MEEENKGKVNLLSSIGAKIYKIIKNLAMLTKHADKSFDKTVALLKKTPNPKPKQNCRAFLIHHN